MDHLRRGIIMSGVGQLLLGCGGSDTSINGLGSEIAANSVISRTGRLSKIDASRAICCYYDSSAVDIKAVVVSVSASGVISFGTPVTVYASPGGLESSVRTISSSLALVLYVNSSGRAEAKTLSISGSSLTAETAVTVSSMVVDSYVDVERLTDAYAAAIYTEQASPNHSFARIIGISGVTPSVGTEVSSGEYQRFPRMAPLDDTRAVFAFQSFAGNVSAVVVSRSGSTPSFGSSYSSGIATTPRGADVSDNRGNLAVSYQLSNVGNVVPATISGSTISFGSGLQLDPATSRSKTVVSCTSGNMFLGMANSASNSKMVLVQSDAGTATLAGPVSDNTVDMREQEVEFVTSIMGIVAYTNASQYLCARSIRL